jgi:hypothetical protein
MKKIILAVCAAALAACASGPAEQPTPPWVVNLEAAYPRSAYIAGLGEGKDRKDAENKALAELSMYFVREASVTRSSRAAWTEQNGVSSSESRTEENILVESQTRLVAVRYAQDPWYNPAVKAWFTVAYIERDEGWTVYEASAKKEADAFMALADMADRETEPFNAVLRYGSAAAYGNGPAYNAARDFAQVLHPARAAELFAGADAAWSGLTQKRFAAREQARVFVNCPQDYNRMVYQAMVKALGAAGFIVEERRNAAAAVCDLAVEEGAQAQASGTMYYPALTGAIGGKGGTFFSFKTQAERQGAVNPDVAKRRAYTALASALESSFGEELRGWQEQLAKR